MDSRSVPGRTGTGPVRLALIGAGDRGVNAYGRFCLDHPDKARLVAVAEPDLARREELGDRHHIPADARFGGWEDLLATTIDYDGLIIATPDAHHAEPAVAALDQGRHVLLEKPLATTEVQVRRLAVAAGESRGSLSVAHELRYAPFFASIKDSIEAGQVGEVVSIDLVENIGYWHFAHSYVRGNWRRSDQASPMILSKSCHDLDILRWLAGSPCIAVSSMGSLHHFRSQNAPDGAPDRCLDGCPVGDTCPFNAVAFYLDGTLGQWPVSVVTRAQDRDAVREALADGPYGRCVYRCDNDAVDHQVAIFEFANGSTATFTATAFTADVTRTLKVMGTRGEIRGNLMAGQLSLQRFQPGSVGMPLGSGSSPAGATERKTLDQSDAHGGGDTEMLLSFVRYLRSGGSGSADANMLTSVEESIESHLMAFAAEQSRRLGRRIEIGAWH